jgi:FkbM family methyltransferase
MSKLDKAPSIICITTDGADYRINNFIEQCNKYNISNYTIQKFKLYKDSNLKLTGKHLDRIHENSKGPVSSHILAIKNWLDNSNEEFVLIVEDDISFDTVQYWNFNFNDFVDDLPQDWECVQLSCIRDFFDNITIKLRPRLNNDWGCQAYLIKRQYAKKLIDKYYISDHHLHLEIWNAKIQVNPGEYCVYDLFPIIENVLFEGIGIVYNMPLFVEDINNTSSNFSNDIGNSNDKVHIGSYDYILNWWKTEGYKKTLNHIIDYVYKNPITIVQLGSHHGYDNLSKYIFKNYQELTLGLFVEANPIHIDKLKTCYSNYKNSIIENIAIKSHDHESDTLQIFFHDKDPDKQVASFDINHVKKHEYCWDSGDIHSFEVRALSLEALLNKYNLTDIDWLLIDIEGLEADIILNLDLNKYRIKKIEFEKLHLGSNKSQILNKLASFGYKKVESLHEYDWAFELCDNNPKDTTTIFALDTEHPLNNFTIAYEYEKIGHTASAFSHYLRCAERTNDIDLIYECLIRGFYCFDAQKDRNFTSSHLLKQAINLIPKRPEAYYLLAKFYEKYQQWYECYTYSSIALDLCDFNNSTLKTNIGYFGKDGLILCKAISSNYWDKIDESRMLLNNLIDDNTELTISHLNSVEYHLTEIEKKRQKHLRYNNSRFKDLRIKFDEASNIIENYSQCYQDIFVLTATNGKRKGTYLEIGSGDPYFGNNTYLLEKQYGWSGLSVDIDSDLVDKFKTHRINPIFHGDASKINYEKFLNKITTENYIDYLQLDCEPPAKTFEVLLSLPFNKYVFGVITYEHDYYLDMTRSYRQKSRNYLRSLGYKLIVNDVSMDDDTSFEDWWVHPELIDYTKLELINNTNINNIEKYIYK